MSQPIPLEDFVALAITLGLPVRGSQSKVTKFLDDQVRVTYPGEMIFGSDPEYAGSSFPGSCKRELSLGSTFFFCFPLCGHSRHTQVVLYPHYHRYFILLYSVPTLCCRIARRRSYIDFPPDMIYDEPHIY